MAKSKNENQIFQYTSSLTRRDSLKWLGALSLSALLPSISGCDDTARVVVDKNTLATGHWPNLELKPINVSGYGKDPNLIIPPKSPWPKTLSPDELTTVAILADILVPRDGEVPSASEVNVPDVIDEWVSAPYSSQQNDRLTILSSIVWLDDEAKLRFGKSFNTLSNAQHLSIIDDIAYQKDDLPTEFVNIAEAFSRFRKLTLAAFFCTPQGTKDIGYIGNTPISGDYPGPTKEAMEHLDKVLGTLNLAL